MRRIVALSTLALVSGLSFAALAGEDDVAYRAILNKDWATAERQLQVGLVRNPDNVFRMLNLAWVYAQTGRKDEAAQLYRRVIASDQDQLAALPSREGASAKALAQAGLARLAAAP
jgi:hypothetical protein